MQAFCNAIKLNSTVRNGRLNPSTEFTRKDSIAPQRLAVLLFPNQWFERSYAVEPFDLAQGRLLERFELASVF